ncbi:MAG: twin-arginine translocation signal domain-containing protein [Planctomycetota bacterium]|nr:twin-arginine translocation signal domain-containing protein [Planctomycetota bacterium]
MPRSPISRRTFLGAVGAIAAASTLPGCGAGGGALPSLATAGLPDDLPGDLPGDPIVLPSSGEEIQKVHFRDLVGETFYVWHPDSGPGEMTLVNYLDRTDRAQTPDDVDVRVPFTLEFEGEEGVVPASGTVTIEHPDVGEHDLHLQRLPPVDGRGLYDIYFN